MIFSKHSTFTVKTARILWSCRSPTNKGRQVELLPKNFPKNFFRTSPIWQFISRIIDCECISLLALFNKVCYTLCVCQYWFCRVTRLDSDKSSFSSGQWAVRGASQFAQFWLHEHTLHRTNTIDCSMPHILTVELLGSRSLQDARMAAAEVLWQSVHLQFASAKFIISNFCCRWIIWYIRAYTLSAWREWRRKWQLFHILSLTNFASVFAGEPLLKGRPKAETGRTFCSNKHRV